MKISPVFLYENYIVIGATSSYEGEDNNQTGSIYIFVKTTNDVNEDEWVFQKNFQTTTDLDKVLRSV